MDKEEDKNSVFMEMVERGVSEGILSFNDDRTRVTYADKKNYNTGFGNPEEKVRAAYFVELVLDKQYPKENIAIEVKVERRIPDDRADIVVYDEDGKDYLVVECKRDGVSDAEFNQAIEQAFGNANSKRAKYAIVVAGTTRTAFDVQGFKQREREKNVIADIPVRYGSPLEWKYYKGDEVNDLKQVSKDELIRVLDKSHKTIWQGGKLAPTTAFDEVSKLLFCKLQDEKESKVTPKGAPYKFQIRTHESVDDVYKRISKIYEFAKKKDEDVFKEEIKLEPEIVYAVVEHLQGINFSGTDLDTKGVAFERFMEDFFKGKMGQYFTPRELIDFAVKMIKPEYTEMVLDTSCGSGGFLLNCLNHIRSEADEEHGKGSAESYRMWHDFAKDNLCGIEINDQIARVCKMNMVVHDDGHTNVIASDALIDIGNMTKINTKFKKGGFDIILTNPPFGATVKGVEKPYLKDYELGKDKKNQKTEILFIERCLEFLKEGTGRMAIVLPDGVLTNSSLQYVRDFIMDNAKIDAIVSLPQIAFSHFGAGVKSSLVFITKKKKDENLGNYPIFMAIAEHIGYDASGRKDPINDLDKILEEYQKFEKNKQGYGGC